MSGIFRGGGGGGNNKMLQYMQIAQEQQSMRNMQGQQMASIAKEQASADMETASMRRPGLGRAMLTYSQRRRETLGG